MWQGCFIEDFFDSFKLKIFLSSYLSISTNEHLINIVHKINKGLSIILWDSKEIYFCIDNNHCETTII